VPLAVAVSYLHYARCSFLPPKILTGHRVSLFSSPKSWSINPLLDSSPSQIRALIQTQVNVISSKAPSKLCPSSARHSSPHLDIFLPAHLVTASLTGYFPHVLPRYPSPPPACGSTWPVVFSLVLQDIIKYSTSYPSPLLQRPALTGPEPTRITSWVSPHCPTTSFPRPCTGPPTTLSIHLGPPFGSSDLTKEVLQDYILPLGRSLALPSSSHFSIHLSYSDISETACLFLTHQ
jgi:hypothetical protein